MLVIFSLLLPSLTTNIFFTSHYNESTLINFNLLQFLVLLFGLLRKKAWNYGRLALLHKSDNRWMELFFGDNDETAETAEASVSAQLSTYDRGFFSWIVTAFKVK